MPVTGGLALALRPVQHARAAACLAAAVAAGAFLRALAFVAFKFLFTGRPVFDSCSSKKQ